MTAWRLIASADVFSCARFIVYSSEGESMSIQKDIYDAIVAGDVETTDRLMREALAAGTPAEALLQEALIAAMTEVGARFECGEYFVSEMLISAQAMQAGLKHLRPLLVAQDVQPIGKVVIGTVKGDLHDIGKNLVAMMLEGAGFQVVDLGVDVPAERFVQAAQKGADLVALSALLTTTMVTMGQVVKALKAAGLSSTVKTLVGGAPLTQDFANQIGADGFAADAAGAATLARQLIGK
jgi:5-methyltetrahydrofolate--homocysteine methyltransferase